MGSSTPMSLVLPVGLGVTHVARDAREDAHQPAAAVPRPRAAAHVTASRRRQSTDGRQFTVYGRLSTVYGRLSTVDGRRSAVDGDDIARDHLAAARNPQPSSAKAAAWSLAPRPLGPEGRHAGGVHIGKVRKKVRACRFSPGSDAMMRTAMEPSPKWRRANALLDSHWTRRAGRKASQ